VRASVCACVLAGQGGALCRCRAAREGCSAGAWLKWGRRSAGALAQAAGGVYASQRAYSLGCRTPPSRTTRLCLSWLRRHRRQHARWGGNGGIVHAVKALGRQGAGCCLSCRQKPRRRCLLRCPACLLVLPAEAAPKVLAALPGMLAVSGTGSAQHAMRHVSRACGA